MGKGRLEAFSDGVFAVAITLLVLDLNLSGHGGLTHQLRAEWPHYAAYVVSFMVIGIIWVNHHGMMGQLRRVDRWLLFLNLLLLMFVVLIPFPTSVMAQYLGPGGWNAKVAVAFYNAVMEAMGLAFSGMYAWAGRHEELLHETVDAAEHRSSLRQFGIGAVAYLVLILIAFLNPLVALVGDFVLAVFYVFDWTAGRAAGPVVTPGTAVGPAEGPAGPGTASEEAE
jgi:uncharacterized membrane protein